MSKLFGFLLGIAVALGLPAGFGTLTAEGGIELDAREMALAYGIGALVFWAVVSYFAGAAALGAALTFGAMIYAVHWIPNRTTNFLNDIPGVTTGMIDGIREYTLNGLVPVLAVISLVYAIQQMVRAVRRRRQLRAEAALRQREQELAQQQEAESQYQPQAPYQAPTPYPAATSYAHGGGGGDYPTSVDNRYEEPYDDDQARRGQSSDYEQTAQYPVAGASASTNNDETTQLPTEQAGGPSTHHGAHAATAEYPTSSHSESPGSDDHQSSDDRPTQIQGGGSSQADTASSQSEGSGSSQPPVGPPSSSSSPGTGTGTGSSQSPGGPSQSDGTGSSQDPGGAPQQPATEAGPREPGRDRGRDLGPQASAQDPTRAQQPGHGPTAGFTQPVQSAEQPQHYGQQYRERMDNPDHHFTVEPEHHPQAFLTNNFRIA